MNRALVNLAIKCWLPRSLRTHCRCSWAASVGSLSRTPSTSGRLGAESRIARELTKPVRALGVALLVLWTLHTVVVTGPLLLSAHYADLLRGTPQGALRAPLGDPIQDATPAVVASLPAHGDVLALVPASEVDGFAYFWLTYWLYPRHVEVIGDLGAAAMGIELWIFGVVHVPWFVLWLVLPWLVVVVVTRRRTIAAVRDEVASIRPLLSGLGDLDPLTAGLVAFTVATLGFYLLNLLAQPLVGWDAIAMWLVKAKVFFDSGSVDLANLPPRPISATRHPDYPPLFSLMVAQAR